MATEALALIEVDAVASGLRALDGLVKRAPVEVLEANLVEPGRFLILFAGGVAEVEESFEAATESAHDGIVDSMLLPFAHSALVAGLRGREDREGELDTLGVIEGRTVAGTLHACDRSLKDAEVRLAGLRVTGGLGGRAYYVVHGLQHDVEAALDAGRAVLEERDALHRVECIPRPHDEMLTWLLRPPPFRVGPLGGP
ncbi:MAG: BMC domain-containing protein [Deltaproteobacteria bacterium]|nr:MAG: BMC domain-containing protein [Deltaproteobacteria bacterium]